MYCQQKKTSEVRCQHQKLVFSATQHFSFFFRKEDTPFLLQYFYSIDNETSNSVDYFLQNLTMDIVTFFTERINGLLSLLLSQKALL